MTDDLEVHDVGIVVFMRAPGVDGLDAAHRAEFALRRVIRSGADETGALIDGGQRGAGLAMPVVSLMEVGTAAGNGYLWLRPTKKAAHERGLEGL